MSKARRRRSRKARFDCPVGFDPRCDLHLHTLRSDGACPPDEVVAMCAQRGLAIIALTDHDVPPSLPAGSIHVGDRTLRHIHGAEISAVYEGRERHILAFFPGEMPASFRAFLQERCRERARRFDDALENLDYHDIPRAPSTAWDGEQALTRYHLAQALVKAGRAGTIQSAFLGPLSRKTGAVPEIELPLQTALDTIRAAGGIPVWAHPDIVDAEQHAEIFATMGLMGLEVGRPSLSSTGQALLSRLALRLGLVTTGGSDWHGWNGRLGSFRMSSREIAPFLALLGPIQANAT